MKKMLFVAGCLFLLSGALNPAIVDNPCDRRCLIELMDRYLKALCMHDPSIAPLAADVRFVENTEKTVIGRGLWQTASAVRKDFKIYAADPVAGQVGFIGVIKVKNKPAIYGIRLKLIDRKISEIDHLAVYKPVEPIDKNFIKPRAGLVQPLKPSERISREQMLKIANSYYEAIVNVDGDLAPFAPECQRRENGVITVNAPERTHEEYARDDFSAFRIMTCSAQISSGIWRSITDISHRRFIAADEEMGLVFAYSILEHNGKPKMMKIVGVPGVAEIQNKYGLFDTVAAHMFKIKNGKIYEVEAIGYREKHGAKNGWE
jgi:hypothetical protein